MVHWFLVKWCSLAYELATWEQEDSLFHECEDTATKVQEFRRRSLLPHQRDPNFYQGIVPSGARPSFGWTKYEESPKFKEDYTLRSYQLEGLNWLMYCWFHGQSSIIADEMGLGKTIQSVAFLNCLYKDVKVRGPFLVVAPLSTIPHWERTFANWTDLNTIVFHGSASSRSVCQNYEFNYFDENHNKITPIAPPGYNKSNLMARRAFNQCKFDVLITTYEMAMSGSSVLKAISNWRVIIVDEAHRLKNKSSKVGEVLKTFNLEHRVLLTGTPIQNSLEELWSILNFLDPRRFPDGNEKEFLAEFDLRSAADVQKLQEVLKPLMLRRLKEDVEKSIPLKSETIIEVEMTDMQRAYYKAIIERNFLFLRQGAKSNNMPNLINTMLELRKCCIHPLLIKGAEDKIMEKHPNDYLSAVIESCGKMVLLDKLLPKLKAGGHRVLIFSQMTKCLDLLGDYLRGRNYSYERIDGAIRGEARQAAIDRYSAPDSDIFIFLLCTRAGGVGINLTAADTCIIYDSDWNPQNDLQAQARCHRIGQKKNVSIYRLLTRNTYEMTMFEKAGMKLGLDKAVLSRMDFDPDKATGPGLSKQEIEELLKKGAYGAMMSDEVAQEESKKFANEDIDSILAKRTQLIVHNGEETTKTEGSLFSKATFGLQAEEDRLEINDPQFWDKWAAKANVDTDVLEEQQRQDRSLIVNEPRRRKKTERAFNDDADMPSDLEFEDETPTGELAKIASEEGFNVWTMAERVKLERGIMLHGFGAWEKKVELLPKRSILDIKAVEISLMNWCIDYLRKEAQKADAKVSRDDLRMLEDCEHIVVTADWAIPSLEEVDQMTEGNCSKAFEVKTTQVEVDEKFGIYPYPDASRQQMIEFYSFLSDCPKVYYDHLEKKCKGLLMRVQLLHFLRECVFDITPWAVADLWVPDPEDSSSTINKYEDMFGRAQVRHQFPASYKDTFASAEGSFKDWSNEEDRDLLLGVLKFGYQSYDQMKNDMQLIFMVRNWGSVPAGADPAIGKPWPGSSELGIRIRKLLGYLQRHHKRGGTDSSPPERSRGTVSSKSDNIWPRKMRSAFLNALNVIGASEEFEESMPLDEAKAAPWRIARVGGDDQHAVVLKRNWAAFREEAGLTNKTDESCEIFFLCFMRKAEDYFKDKHPKELRREGHFWPFDRPSLEGNEDPDERFKLMDGSGNRAHAADSMAGERIRRLTRRILLFHTIRGIVLVDPNVDTVMAKAKMTAGLPEWWVIGAHDKAFLQAVAKHGMTPLRQNMALFDEDFPFREILIKKLKEAGFTEAFDRLKQLATMTKEEMKAAGIESSDITPEAEEKGLLGGKTMEEFLNWPKDLIRTRRVEILVELAVKESEKSLTYISSSRDSRRRFTEIGHLADSTMTPLHQAPHPLESLWALTDGPDAAMSDGEVEDDSVRDLMAKLRGVVSYLKKHWADDRVKELANLISASAESHASEEKD